jgi:transcriptional regulator with XRE-family HTH domain
MDLSASAYLIPDEFVQVYKPQFSLILALSTALLVSTGTGVSFTNFSDMTSVDNVPVITFVQYEKGAKDVAIAHHELLLHIRDSFKMSMTELAGILNVSRAALYAWFQGSTPRPDLLDRLWQLNQYADAISALKIDRIDLLTRIPLSSGATILQALSRDQGVEEAVAELGALSKSREASIEQIRSKPAKARVHTVDQISSTIIDFA